MSYANTSPPWAMPCTPGIWVSTWAFTNRTLEALVAKVDALAGQAQQPVSVIGWSLGGLYAREIARETPRHVRQVLTLGTPFARSLKASSIRPLYEWVSGNRADDVDPELFASIQKPPPVPTTAIFTLSDGIVAWETTVEQEEGDSVQNIPVSGSHCGLGHNIEALKIIADRLSQHRDNWQPYKPAESSQTPVPTARCLQAATQRLEFGLSKLETLIDRKLEAAHGSASHQ